MTRARLKQNVDDTVVMLTNEMTEVVMCQMKLKEVDAAKLASSLVHGLREKLGGQDVYIPAADKYARDLGILNDYKFTPESLNLVTKKYGVSKRTVYRIMRKRYALLSKKIAG